MAAMSFSTHWSIDPPLPHQSDHARDDLVERFHYVDRM
jgi:hypothetical protein